ncbi:uncharacterized protein PAC_17855 [Phialocephala subalpina]|uniref:Heterokaryon incompatibility domain-containing protein n=1 Tax=Phialocephala subalpina TaxID=576137 RepID=A0A1L7XSD0_9HELO|nr:uncharacterized protein PAC_17855 [Phialocephala subalpina]
MLCNLCNSIEWDGLDQDPNEHGYPGLPHHLSFAALSSPKDCEFCTAIALKISSDKELETGDQKWRQHPIFLRVFPSSDAIGDESDKSNLLVYCTPNDRNELEQKPLAFFGLCVDRTEEEWVTGEVDSENPVSRFIAGRPISQTSNTENCFRLAITWLDQCAGKHQRPLSDIPDHNPTRTMPTRSFMPTRTIDVGPTDGTCEPRLVDHTKEHPNEYQQWVTLSHCWGGTSPLRTTLDMLEERKTSIPLSQMPQTFHDAVIITRKLGIRHLWIDSLCIIQDSKNDWSREAALMGEVYKHGILNIAANTGRGCHDGIFTVRDDSEAIQLPLHSAKHHVSGYMYARFGKWDAYQPGVLGVDSSLSSRGWVLQESVLSPRTLHYSKQQMFWECRHFTFAEGNIAPVVDANTSSRSLVQRWVSNKMVVPPEMVSGKLVTSRNERAKAHTCWMLIVKGYTTRCLTVSSDVFAALAGVAAIFQKTLGDRYLAGLFEGDLLVSLLWSSVEPQSAQRRSAISAPSWSWASIIGPVALEIAYRSVFLAPQLVGNCTAKSIKARTFKTDGSEAPANQFTDIKSGLIVIEGYLLKQGDDLEDLCYLRRDAEVVRENQSDIQNFMTYKQNRILGDFEDALQITSADSLAILHIGIWEWWGQKDPGTATTWFTRRFAGLLLKARDDGSYERIGVVKMDVGFQNVNVDSLIQAEDEHFIENGWERATVTIT